MLILNIKTTILRDVARKVFTFDTTGAWTEAYLSRPKCPFIDEEFGPRPDNNFYNNLHDFLSFPVISGVQCPKPPSFLSK